VIPSGRISQAALWILVLSLAYGILFTIRVGGADMPITISLLNSFSGIAASISGLAVRNPLLVAIGAIVGASGLILTRLMCKAMNRSLSQVLTGKTVLISKKPDPGVSLSEERRFSQSLTFAVKSEKKGLQSLC